MVGPAFPCPSSESLILPALMLPEKEGVGPFLQWNNTPLHVCVYIISYLLYLVHCTHFGCFYMFNCMRLNTVK